MSGGSGKGLAKAVLMLSLLMLAAVSYLSFVVPKTVQGWAQMELELSPLQTLAASLSSTCRAYGLLAFAPWIITAVGAWFWLRASRRRHFDL